MRGLIDTEKRNFGKLINVKHSLVLVYRKATPIPTNEHMAMTCLPALKPALAFMAGGH